MYEKFGDKIEIYSIPTSGVAYEFTRKVYELLGLDVKLVYDKFNAYDLIDETKNEKIIKNLQDMNFRAVIGNTPYQVMDGGTDRGAVPIYQNFVRVTKQIGSRYISMIMPAKWYCGGRGLDDFRNEMLNDRHIQKMFDFPKCRDVFPNVDIAGGICYFLMDNLYDGLCKFCTKEENGFSYATRHLNDFDIFVRSNIGLEIINKVRNNTENFADSLVLQVSPFGLRSYIRGEENKKSSSDVIVVSSGGKGYIRKDEITKNADLINKWKIYVGYLNPDRAGVNNSTTGSNVTTKINILKPGEVITESYIVLGCFDTHKIAKNYSLYIKTKFVRFLVFMIISSIHITSMSFRFVPNQDFTSNSDIDWSKSVAEIDKQLYKKYGLTKEETEFIEKMIKPM